MLLCSVFASCRQTGWTRMKLFANTASHLSFPRKRSVCMKIAPSGFPNTMLVFWLWQKSHKLISEKLKQLKQNCLHVRTPVKLNNQVLCQVFHTLQAAIFRQIKGWDYDFFKIITIISSQLNEKCIFLPFKFLLYCFNLSSASCQACKLTLWKM